ncbi:hypothetical protein E2C01_088040 [Portunus trituberculatus]|uniref:Uncharacterized protein n=1 Tax=Portunus trituberculatus TaxID=210409 RepID=A0A5B7JIT7_PORTR|nr:hypothetical protein [Portunus trituberculatus]
MPLTATPHLYQRLEQVRLGLGGGGGKVRGSGFGAMGGRGMAERTGQGTQVKVIRAGKAMNAGPPFLPYKHANRSSVQLGAFCKQGVRAAARMVERK